MTAVVWSRLMGRCLIVLALACVSSHASSAGTGPALEYHSVIRNYGHEAGLPQNSVNTLLQDQGGYLWLGTYGGLVKFDGNKFTTFRATRGSPSEQHALDGGGPSSNRIVALREDASGRIWIGSEDGGLSLYDHGRFLQLPMCGGGCEVFALSPQVGQTIWAVTNAGVFRIATDSLRATAIRDQSPGHYTEIAIGSDGRVYLGGAGMNELGLVVEESIVSVPLPQGATSAGQVWAAGKYVWVGTDKEIHRFDPLRNSWALASTDPDVRPLKSSPDGSPWMVTRDGKLLHADRSGKLSSFPGLPAMFINAVWWDREGVLWVGSSDKGLWSIQNGKAMIFEGANSELYVGRAVVGDGMHGAWLGYSCGGVRHRFEDGTYEKLSEQVANRNECVVSLLRDSGGDLWIGSVRNGLQRISNGVAETIPQTSKLPNLQVWQADDGEYWLAAEGHTFRILRTNKGALVLSQPVPALEGMTIRKMVMAREGGIWFAGDQGVIRLEDGRVVERWGPEQGLSSRFARALYEDRRGVLWIGTYGGGLNRIENGKVIHYDESNGLFDDTVSCILADRNGQMWLAGNRGISVLPMASQGGLDFETVPFAVSSGSVSLEFNGGTQSSCHQDEDGHLWFALVKGFARIDPARLAEITIPHPDVYIERVASSGLKLDSRQTVFLDASAQLLEIEYTAINLTSADQLSFRYRISGVNTGWTDAGAIRNIIIQNVPWGDYLFEVQARNRGGSWSPSAILRISRPIPWYQRQWLWPLIALLMLLAVMWRTREHNLPSRHSERLNRITGREPGGDGRS